MPNTLAEIETIITHALHSLDEGEGKRGLFTAATHQTEWNLAHHLAMHIAQRFPDYACDVDVIKSEYGNMRPDIIVHRRGTNGHNHLVIEVKRNDHQGMLNDQNKIRNDWFYPPLSYRFGAVVNLREPGQHEFLVEENPAAPTIDLSR